MFSILTNVDIETSNELKSLVANQAMLAVTRHGGYNIMDTRGCNVQGCCTGVYKQRSCNGRPIDY